MKLPLSMQLPPENPGRHNYCSFCAKSKDEVAKLHQGPMGAICNECVELLRDAQATPSPPPPLPSEAQR